MNEKQLKRFWKKVKKTSYCWNWIATKYPQGYGHLNLNWKDEYAHRISWKIHFGKIPNNKQVLHKCDNPSCVNPQHLWLGTIQDNMKDRNKKGRFCNLYGEQSRNHKLTLKDVLKIRNLYKKSKFTQIELGKIFNTGDSNINHIINNRTWHTETRPA